MRIHLIDRPSAINWFAARGVIIVDSRLPRILHKERTWKVKTIYYLSNYYGKMRKITYFTAQSRVKLAREQAWSSNLAKNRESNVLKVIYTRGNDETKSVIRDLRCRIQTVSPRSRRIDESLLRECTEVHSPFTPCGRSYRTNTRYLILLSANIRLTCCNCCI